MPARKTSVSKNKKRTLNPRLRMWRKAVKDAGVTGVPRAGTADYKRARKLYTTALRAKGMKVMPRRKPRKRVNPKVRKPVKLSAAEKRRRARNPALVLWRKALKKHRAGMGTKKGLPKKGSPLHKKVKATYRKMFDEAEHKRSR